MCSVLATLNATSEFVESKNHRPDILHLHGFLSLNHTHIEVLDLKDIVRHGDVLVEQRRKQKKEE